MNAGHAMHLNVTREVGLQSPAEQLYIMAPLTFTVLVVSMGQISRTGLVVTNVSLVGCAEAITNMCLENAPLTVT